MKPVPLDLAMLDELETQAQAVAERTARREANVDALLAQLPAAPLSEGLDACARQIAALEAFHDQAAELTANTEKQLAAMEESLLQWMRQAEKLMEPIGPVNSRGAES